MDTSSAYSGSASDRQIVEISNLTKVVDQSEPHSCSLCYKGFEIIYVCFYINTNFRNSIVLKNAQSLD